MDHSTGGACNSKLGRAYVRLQKLPMVDKAESANTGQDSTFQIDASWQANKNFLFKLLEIVGLPPQVLGLGFVLRIVSLGVFLREPMKILMRKGSCLLFSFSTSKWKCA
ncbi:hypothetical protein C5167_006463 [Papaver somniferum]|uniref:Uncharacterized protein n=1 Tax=Papaver somniferum TaxID=3469 RepID=A0A4Y7JDE0_PAPSO|nr:hypothetical protein C5167_006463 [Papaver somniferum]